MKGTKEMPRVGNEMKEWFQIVRLLPGLALLLRRVLDLTTPPHSSINHRPSGFGSCVAKAERE